MAMKRKCYRLLDGERSPLFIFVLTFCLGWGVPVSAEEEVIPWECSEYTGEFQQRCIKAVQEMEDNRFEVFHRQREQPDERVTQLQRELNRQAEVISKLESQLRSDNARRYRKGYGYNPRFRGGRWLGVPWKYPGFYGFGPGYGGGRRFRNR